MRLLLLLVGVWIASTVATTGAYFLAGVAHDALRRPHHARVAFSDMLAMMDDGMVEEIRVHGNVFTFKIKSSSGRTGTRESIGPRLERAQLATLRPARPGLPAPRITLE